MNKILVVCPDQKDKESLEEILSALVEKGAELLFSNNKASALQLIEEQRPVLVFFDSSLLESDEKISLKEGSHLVLIHERKQRDFSDEDSIFKPFHHAAVLEKCHKFLSFWSLQDLYPM